jgi:alpha-L-fucosidase
MEPWFTSAKLGIFIHWGIYAVRGVPESWSFFNGEIGYDDYMDQLQGFTGSHFDPDQWAELFGRAGARYAVLTAKHHDGVALFDTRHSDLSTVRRTPAGRDLVREFVDAMRRHDLRVGLYFSHLDWSHPDYATVRRRDAGDRRLNRFSAPPPGEEDPQRWERFLGFHRAQIEEIVRAYHPDLLWFDGEWERDEPQWRMRELRAQIRDWDPHAVVNGRMLGFGDYATPEQGVPIEPPEGPWELCLTINDSWGWQGRDRNYKSVRQLVRIFAETIGAGGNLLLDVGPHEDGTITEEQRERLEGLGLWIDRHAAAIYDTRRGLPCGHFHGASTLSPDRRTLYLFLFDRPNEHVVLRGLRTPVHLVRVVGSASKLRHRRYGGLGEVPGLVYIDVSDEHLDPLTTVLAVEFEEPLELYRGKGRD